MASNLEQEISFGKPILSDFLSAHFSDKKVVSITMERESPRMLFKKTFHSK